MRILALDIGEKRTGIAVSDVDGKVAMPVKVLATAEVMAYSAAFRRVIEDFQPQLLLFGIPITLSGEEGPQAKRVRELAEGISTHTDLPSEFFDERLSSVEAKRILRENGHSERSMRGKTDMIAASLLLQAYLEAHDVDSTDANGHRMGPME